ncbi:hypothetical protein RAS1_31590 [Phycisphaerae bacterium RAS1]|nr:hypothetical protein RAS1_31590 [Phycisphaerae bacterium RAS1]
MILHYNRIGPWACAIICAAISQTASADELYTALRHEVLCAQLQLQVERVSFGGADGCASVGYVLPGEGGDRFGLAAYTSVAGAQRSLRRVRDLVAVGLPPPPDDPIGEEMVWGSDDGSQSGSPCASFTWRRKNVVIDLWKRGDPAQVVALARQIDALLRDNRQFAPLGTFDPPPEIVSISAPETITFSSEERAKWGKTFRVTPEFRGLGDVQNLRIKVRGEQNDRASNGTLPDGKSNPRILVPGGDFSGRGLGARQRTPEEDGRFEISLVRNVKPGPLKLTMIVATPDNVVVTKEFTITVGQ